MKSPRTVFNNVWSKVIRQWLLFAHWPRITGTTLSANQSSIMHPTAVSPAPCFGLRWAHFTVYASYYWHNFFVNPFGSCHRTVFKWLSKVITWLRLLRLVIGLKDSRLFFNQWDTKPKSISPCTRDFSRASGELQVIARNCDWFMELFVPVIIGRSNCFGFGFSTVIWKPLYFSLLIRLVVKR